MSPPHSGTGLGELYRALAVLAEPPAPEHDRIASILGLPAPADAETSTRLFSIDYVPFASVYVGGEGQVGGEAADRIAGFWRALGESPPSNADELPVVLGLHAHLWDESVASPGGPAERARSAFFWEHVASWLVPLGVRITGTRTPFYAEWAATLITTMATDASTAGPPAVLPLHFRQASPFELDNESSADDIAAALLVPIRSGMILGRPDIARMMTDLGVTTRLGSRRYALHDAVETNRAAALEWLAAESLRQAALWLAVDPSLQPVSAFWSGRARSAAVVLSGLVGEVEP